MSISIVIQVSFFTFLKSYLHTVLLMKDFDPKLSSFAHMITDRSVSNFYSYSFPLCTAVNWVNCDYTHIYSVCFL